MKRFFTLLLLLLAFILILVYTTPVLAEGSRNIAPSYTGTGSLVAPSATNKLAWLEHDGPNGFSGNFLDPAANDNEKMYIRMLPGETLRYGLRRIAVRYDNTNAYSAATVEGNNQDLTIVIYDTNGNIVHAAFFDTNAASTGAATLQTSYWSGGTGTNGIISSVAASKLGPQFIYSSNTINAGGYTPLSYTNNTGTDQDFYVAFIQDDYTYSSYAQLISDIQSNTITDQDIRSWYDLWDFSIYNGNEEKPGRMHCKRWNLNVQDLYNVLTDETSFYAQVPSVIDGVDQGNYIKRIDLGGLAAFSAIIYANSQGSDGTDGDSNGDGSTNFGDYRMSTDSDIGQIEYDMFINNPDIELYPTTILPTINITNAQIYCGTSGNGEAVISFESNQSGQIALLVNLDGESGYQEGTEDVIVETSISEGIQNIRWDGLDGLGNPVPAGTTIYISGRFTAGPIHVPLFDVESNSTGMNMVDIRPSTSFDLIYWDDRNIAAGSTPTSDLDGTNTSLHTWADGDEYLVNTWSFGYYQINSQIISFDYSCDQDNDGVSDDSDLDLDNDGLVDSDEGDGLGDDDGDNIPNYTDKDIAGYVDSNGDGINDNYDNDLDGIPNVLDRDSDNDGISDVVEIGGSDSNSDGVLDCPSQYTVSLTVTDNLGGTATHSGSVTVASDGSSTSFSGSTLGTVGNVLVSGTDAYFEAECGQFDDGVNFQSVVSGTASNGSYVESLGDQTGSAPTGADERIRFNFTIAQPGDYEVWALVNSQGSGANDSYWVTSDVDAGNYTSFNNWGIGGNFEWVQVDNIDDGDGTDGEYTYPAGDHYIDFAYREDGARLDMIFITSAGTTPSGTGGAINCNTPPTASIGVASASGTAPYTVNFSNPSTDSDGTITDYLWDFGDGTTSTAATPSHVFNIGGNIIDLNNNGICDTYDAACDGLATVTSGNAVNQTNNSVTNANNAVGAPDGNYATTNNAGDQLNLDLGVVVPSGTTIYINMRRDTGTGNLDMTVRGSLTGSGYADAQTITINQNTTATDYGYDLTSDARYIQIQPAGGTVRRIYHASFSYSTPAVCSGGVALVAPDTDGDGILDHLDLDSDNDGITDTYESGGIADPATGQISGFTDTNKNGLNDAQEIVSLVSPDSDGDGLVNHRDIDSDNDGIPDNHEGQASNVYITIVDGDSDGDGLLDVYDPTEDGTLIVPVDSDSDGDYDYMDTDADGDGVADIIEGWDANFNGRADWDATGNDNDITNETGYNTDTDGDGLWDVFDNTASTGIANIVGSDAVLQNTDGADLKDWQDSNDDNDNSPTSGEDTNNNGDWSDDFADGGITIPDYLFRGDLDGDAIADALDADSDNDGISDVTESNGESIDPSKDADGDGLPNYRDPDISGSLSSSADINGDDVYDVYDSDLDGIPDFLDLDSDNDGLWDAIEAYGGSIPNGLNQTSGRFALNDPDNDGLMNYIDSSPASAGGTSTLANPDSDGDGIRDYIDLDSDADGIQDIIEAQTTASLIELTNIDTDGDGIDDAFDPDNGGTLIVPVNSDGLDLQDYLDSDSDNDNITDLIEGNDSNRDGITDVAPSGSDTDGDGLDDAFDPDNGGSLPVLQNTDGVDFLDWRDIDDDNDLELTKDEDANGNGDYTDDFIDGQGISGIPDYLFNGDFDMDGVSDYIDEDDDNDGIPDSDEGYENVVLTNGSFENPSVTGVQFFDEGTVDGWNTTASDNQIEIWETGSFSVPSYDGGQHLEINANEDAQLYQDVVTEPGVLIYWTIAHRGRDGDDSFKILIGPSSGPVDNGTFVTGNTAWVVYSGYYLVPAGQTTTRFAFESVSTASGNATIGNFIDAFALYATQSGGDSDGDGLPDYQDRDSNNNGIADIIEAGGTDSDGDGEVDTFTDTDNDGLHDPYDANNGGISLSLEDTDGDGILDVLDLDSDNDGIPDLIEIGGIDANGDGRLDDITDTDKDGFADLHDVDNGGTQLTNIDTDFDGIPDIFDLDSDNDGITDATENGGGDSNGNGYIDGFETDTDNDGLCDSVDPDNGGTPIANIDTDNDGYSDFRDLDSDNDGLPDIIEAGGVDTDYDGIVDELLDIDHDGIPANADVTQTGGTDADGDGIDDLYDVTYTGGNDDDGDGIDNVYDKDKDGDGFNDYIELNPYTLLDTDGDGNKNFRDLDSDNDGIVDVIEFGLTADASTGSISGFTDTDSDGLNDAQDGYIGTTVNASVSPITPINSDTGTEPSTAVKEDYRDLDSDNDGIVDLIEGQTKISLLALSGNDANDNGLDDTFDPLMGGTLITPTNTDGDGNPDYLDDDSDGDGVLDLLEGHNGNKNLYADWDADNDGNFDDAGYNTDTDADGLLDIFDNYVGTGISNVTGSTAAVQDTDRDGWWDFQDVDDDNDGTNTATESKLSNDDPNGIIPDYLYGDQDVDNDGVSNANDADADNDGLANTSEDGGTGIDPGADSDGDGLYNFEDTDIDGDGTSNTADTNTGGVSTVGFTDSNADGVIDQFDKDLDGVPDFMDRDSDNDGIADILELGLTDANNDGTLDEGAGITDVNGNGIADAYDITCDGTVTYIDHYSISVHDNNGMTNTANVPGAPNGSYASTNANGEYMSVYFDQTIPNGSTVYLNIALATNDNFAISFFQSANGITFTNQLATTTTGGNTPTNYAYTLNADANYIRFRADGGTERRLYHIYFTESVSCNGGVAITTSDTDSDGIANYLDLDSDADGIPDNVEAQLGSAYVAPVLIDADGDGIMDVYDEDVSAGNALNPIDTDTDGTDDYLDLDSDNDGIADVIEAWDSDSDGFGDWDSDNDNDPTDEGGYNSDTDKDGISYLFDSSTGRGTAANINGSNAPIQDTNNDGTPDYRDTDDDGDGALTSNEDANTNLDWTDDFTQGGGTIPNYLYAADNDGDGVLNNLDPDSDGDGVPNSLEYDGIVYSDNSGPFGDDDGDGLYNYLDSDASGHIDVNGDGVDDRLDKDRDGIPNFFDLDSDNDGIRDEDENSSTNYALGGTTSASSVSGTYGSPLSVVTDGDTDGNGEAQSNHTNEDNEAFIEIDLGAVYDISTVNVWNRTDCCTDRADNFYVFASETAFSANDVTTTLAQSGVSSIFQTQEVSSPSVFNFNTTARYIRVQLTETNFLHLAEVEVYSPGIDTDSDGIPNFLDLDSDGDGITDNREAQTTAAYIAISDSDTDEDGLKDVYDADNGGITLVPIDTDGDTTPDYLDTDSDNDNILDVIEGFDANKNGFSDLDTDQDGDLSDESGYGNDIDEDGLEKLFDNYSGYGIGNITGSKATIQDTDGDGIVDYRDDEDDSDGINSISEDTSNGAGGGADGIYYNDKTQGGGATPDYLFFNDTDDDGIADGQDLDSDNDGIIDDDEASGVTYTGASGPFDDDDSDGLFNYLDSDATNYVDNDGDGIDDRVDADSDGVPNFFDLDSDNDGIPDGVEANSGVLPTGQGTNGQFPGGAADADTDGLADNVDGGSTSTLANPDTDGDGIPDFLDLDSDNDGITDLVEAGGNDYNGDGRLDSFGDTDGDGLGNSVDSDNSGTPLSYPDTDTDSSPDYVDVDSEDDGTPDYYEGFYEAGPTNWVDSYINRVTSYNTANAATGHTLYNTTDAIPLDGRPDYANDSDGDGIPNILDPDSGYFIDDDGDGLINLFDPDQNGNFYGNVSGEPDRDSDGTPNILDSNDIPLPLDFLGFSATDLNGKVLLKWETTNEVDVSHFEIERSIDGKKFTTIGVLDAYNIKEKINNYSFVDGKPEMGFNYYRLKELDFDGAHGYSQMVYVIHEGTGIEWMIYPNPTCDVIKIRSNVTIPESQLSIIDLTGRVIYQQLSDFGSNEKVIDLEELPAGIYHLQLKLPTHTESFRVIKQ
ncbi:MAG: T9SS type A sorting domain-containing protein [Marinoscillum sp.]